MALRLAFDLALHLDLSSYVARGSVSTTDAKLRRTVFWAAYMVDQSVIHPHQKQNCIIKAKILTIVLSASILVDRFILIWRM
jgi:hypothetical protein